MEEINLGNKEEPRVTYISSLLPMDLKKEVIALLQEYKDCFLWDYKEIPRLDSNLVKHKLPIKREFRPFQQLQWRMSKEVELR